MKTSRKQSLIHALIALLILGGFAAIYTKKETSKVVINKIDMQQIVSSNEGNVSTRYSYRIYTDNGLYEIIQDRQLFSHPELIGRIHEGDTVVVTSRGINAPLVGMFRIIVAIEE